MKYTSVDEIIYSSLALMTILIRKRGHVINIFGRGGICVQSLSLLIITIFSPPNKLHDKPVYAALKIIYVFVFV
jgi:hypothetical protein